MACSRRSWPVPVFLNRFLAVFDVFIFGIGCSLYFLIRLDHRTVMFGIGILIVGFGGCLLHGLLGLLVG